LANLLEHRIDVHSTPGKGSCFSIRVPMGREHANAVDRTERPPQPVDAPFLGTILVIEDETSVRAALDRLLRFHGLDVISVATGNEALALVTEKGICPSLLVSDYNLPGEMNGVKSIEALRAALGRKIPAIVLTGDIRSPVTQAISKHDVSIAIKPVKADEILRLINRHRVDAIAGVPMSALSDKMV
jgi:CheY-like chemotaxis protein